MSPSVFNGARNWQRETISCCIEQCYWRVRTTAVKFMRHGASQIEILEPVFFSWRFEKSVIDRNLRKLHENYKSHKKNCISIMKKYWFGSWKVRNFLGFFLYLLTIFEFKSLSHWLWSTAQADSDRDSCHKSVLCE